MIPQQTIDEILNLDIIEVIGRYVKLTRKGTNHQGLCPFHGEKTASFSVSGPKMMFKCFGCGKSGNAIGFVMEYKKVDFVEAVKIIGADHGISVKQEESTKEDDEQYKHRENLYAANKLAAGYFRENLLKDEKALAYVKGRWGDDVMADFNLGYSLAGWDNLKKWAVGQGMREDILLETGLLTESKNKTFDYFRDRIIFPIMNRTGRIVGFTGRDFSGDKDAPKYFNTRETDIYAKGKVLYGYHSAYRSIKEKKYVHLVEGNPDVIKMHQIGKLNTVGTCGTALTSEQIAELKKHTESVTIIGDSDKAGQLAVMRSGKMLIEAGMFCNVIELPTDEKNDPDSFFTDGDQFDEYAKEHIRDYILWLAIARQNKCKSPDLKSKLIDELSDLITRLPSSSHQLYIEQLSQIIKPKKAWQDRIKQLLNDEPKEEKSDHGIPDHISLSDWEKYGFYADGNQYWFKTKNGPVRGCNFTMEPLFHIASVLNAKRLYKITNEYGFSQVIELLQRDLISLGNFKLRVESLGNFLFEGTDNDLNKLKRFLYEKTQSCFEIAQLGWQKQGFWAWCNGIYNDKFTETDYNGIVEHDGQNYYLPANSDIYKGEDGLFASERLFKFKPGDITLYDYSAKLMEVFGDNAMYAVCFYLASLYRDHIVKLFGFFPIMNLFGPKGAGKTELAVSIMQFFGPQKKGPNILNTTRAALADHVALFSNSCCHIDEYKNNLENEKIEFLKGLWDGTGRTRMNMDKDKKKETTHVDCGIILSGQEMPTADIALFSRLIFLSFNKVEYTDEEKINFNNLKSIEKLGIAHITHEMLSHRKYFITNFLDNYKAASDELAAAIGDIVIEDRIFRNWLLIIATYRTLKDLIEVPWVYRTLLDNAARLIVNQNKETKKSNELSIFWSIVEFLANNNEIREDVDFKIDYANSIKTDKITTEVEWSKPRNVLLLNHSRVFQLYRVHGQRAKENILPLKTLEYYLINSKEYFGRKSSVSFKVEDNRRLVEDTEISVNPSGVETRRVTRRITTAMAFDYDALHISIHNNVDNVEVERQFQQPSEGMPF
jgi:DNA primase catalytic core